MKLGFYILPRELSELSFQQYAQQSQKVKIVYLSFYSIVSRFFPRCYPVNPSGAFIYLYSGIFRV